MTALPGPGDRHDREGAIATDRSSVVRVRGVTKSFGGAAALKGVDLDLYPGEVHALMGMNGAGKSTLVQILSGVQQPDGGTVEVGGAPICFVNPGGVGLSGVDPIFGKVPRSGMFPADRVAE